MPQAAQPQNSKGGRARNNQKDIRLYRENQGSTISVNAQQSLQDDSLTREEKKLLSLISEGGRRGRWAEVAAAWASYAGQALPLYGAAMQAAIRCGTYDEAATMYNSLASMPSIQPNVVCLHLGIKIYGKLQNRTMVQYIWTQAEDRGLVNKIIAGARINAAAEMGDIVDAASILDYMVGANLSMELPVWTSAINACKNSNPPSPEVAMYFFQNMLQSGISPNIVTFSSLVGSHKKAPLKEVVELRASMADFNVKPDGAFAETYLGAVCHGRLKDVWKVEDVAERLEGIENERLQEVRVALAGFKAANIRLSKLCRFLDQHLQGSSNCVRKDGRFLCRSSILLHPSEV